MYTGATAARSRHLCSSNAVASPVYKELLVSIGETQGQIRTGDMGVDIGDPSALSNNKFLGAGLFAYVIRLDNAAQIKCPGKRKTQPRCHSVTE